MRELIDKAELLKQIDIDSDGKPGWYGDTWQFIETIENMPAIDAVSEWIPCSERLPEEGEIVLVYMKPEAKYDWEEQRFIEFGRISSDRYDAKGTGWEWLNESAADFWEPDWNNYIVAWMDFPKPYREDRQ